MSDGTRILSQIEKGAPQAAEKLLPLVYDDLRKLAAAKLAHEKPAELASHGAGASSRSFRYSRRGLPAIFALQIHASDCR
jgi:hypothetical protein